MSGEVRKNTAAAYYGSIVQSCECCLAAHGGRKWLETCFEGIDILVGIEEEQIFQLEGCCPNGLFFNYVFPGFDPE